MSDILTTFTHVINSPPGQLVAGGVLAGIVWKFFERVEAVLTDQTKLEIAVWLLDQKKLRPTVQSWPNTFTTLFNKVFGYRQLSLLCLGRSCLVSMLVACVWGVAFWPFPYLGLGELRFEGRFVILVGVGIILTDYVSLLITRVCLRIASNSNNQRFIVLLLALDGVVTACVALLGICLAHALITRAPFIITSI